MLVDELDRHRAFADRRRAPLRGAVASIAGGEDAGNARLEQVLRSGCVAGEDETVRSTRDSLVEPLGARPRAEEEEEVGQRQLLAVLERDGAESPVASVQLRDLAVVTNADTEPVE